VDIRLDPLPEGAQLFRLWVGDHVYGQAIDTVGVVVPKGDGVCEIQATHGVLPPEGLILLGTKLYEEGYRIVDFQTIKGTQATHYAKRIAGDEDWDYWRVYLDEEVARYLKERGL